MSNSIDLEFYSPKDNFGTVKATVHKTGKLGFSSGAAKMLELEKKGNDILVYTNLFNNKGSIYCLYY